MVSSARQTGRAAAAAGIATIVGIEGEWLLDPQTDDGTVTNLPVFVLLLVTATIGFVLLFLAVRGLRALGPATTAARIGGLLTLVGAGCLVVFGLTGLLTSVVTGSPWEASFVAFLLAMLLLSVGPVTWGLSLRRRSPAPGVWQVLVLSGVAAFAALALEPDPWHDLALVIAFAGWTAVGVLLVRQEQRSAHGVGAPRSARV